VANAIIDELPSHWWVSRVFVKQGYRRRGFGSRCLKRAIELVRKQNAKPIIVMPGGYDIPFEVQQSFYRHHGFMGDEEMKLVE